MRRNTAGLVLLVVLAVAGCTSRTGGPVGQAGPSGSTSPPPTTTTTVDTTFDVCESLDTAAYSQLLSIAAAIGGDEEGAALRANVAATYTDFAENLNLIVAMADGNLRTALIDWATASVEVAQFVATTEPGPGLVIDFGPAHPRWQAAKAAAEKECGHPLPNN